MFNRKIEYCECDNCTGITCDTESNSFGYQCICCDCGKPLEDEFHYYNHYDGEDHDDIDLY